MSPDRKQKLFKRKTTLMKEEENKKLDNPNAVWSNVGYAPKDIASAQHVNKLFKSMNLF